MAPTTEEGTGFFEGGFKDATGLLSGFMQFHHFHDTKMPDVAPGGLSTPLRSPWGRRRFSTGLAPRPRFSTPRGRGAALRSGGAGAAAQHQAKRRGDAMGNKTPSINNLQNIDLIEVKNICISLYMYIMCAYIQYII